MAATAREEQRNSRIVWFEIPIENLERAIKFYESILTTCLKPVQFGSETIDIFPHEPPAIGSRLIHATDLRPGHGVLPALNADPSLDAVLERAEPSGGKVLMPRVELPEGVGCLARIEDTEGNLVGLHAVS